jgi:mRNA-degrading endonuclease RelE of RelBE toxin-antitoxin system
MWTVIETPVFSRYATDIWTDDELEAFVDWIASNPEAGNVIPDSGGLRKLHWGRAGMGKQGGSRVVYFLRTERGEIVLLIVYAKSKFDSLSLELMRRLRGAFDGS